MRCENNNGEDYNFHCGRMNTQVQYTIVDCIEAEFITVVSYKDCFFYWNVVPAEDPNMFYPRPGCTFSQDKWQDLTYRLLDMVLSSRLHRLAGWRQRTLLTTSTKLRSTWYCFK